MRGLRAAMSTAWRGLAVPVGLVLLAEALALLTHYDGTALARPSEIAAAAVEALFDGSILDMTRQTLTVVAAGVAIGGSIGLVVGLLLGLFPILHGILEVPLETLRPIPSVALIPVALLIFGLGYAMEISLVAKTATWPVLFLTYASVRSVKPRLIEVARLLGIGFFAQARKIVVPAALPGIVVGLRLSVGAALIVAVTIEIAANPLGLGHAMMMAEERLRPDLMYAYLVWIGVVGWAINAAILAVERRFVVDLGRGRSP